MVVPALHRVVAITRNEMQGGMHDGRLFRAGLTKCAASSFLFLFFFSPTVFSPLAGKLSDSDACVAAVAAACSGDLSVAV